MRKVLVSLITLAGLAIAASASAAEPFTAGKIQAGGGLNYGIFMGDDDQDPPNPYGLGLGLGAGYTLGFGLYLGGEFNYFFGSTEETSGVETSMNIMQFGANVGYDLGLSPQFVLRPMLGIGSATGYTESTGGGLSFEADESGLMIPIGAQALYSMGSWYLSGQARYAIFNITTETGGTETDWNGNGLILGVGAGAAF